MQAEYALNFYSKLTRHQKHTHTHTENKSECVTQRRKIKATTALNQHYKNRGVIVPYSLLTEQLNGNCTQTKRFCFMQASIATAQRLAHHVG